MLFVDDILFELSEIKEVIGYPEKL